MRKIKGSIFSNKWYKPFSFLGRTIKLIGITTICLCTSYYKADDFIETAPIFKINKDDIATIENNTSFFTIEDTIIINKLVENTQTTIDGQEIILEEYYAEGELKDIWYHLSLLKDQISVI